MEIISVKEKEFKEYGVQDCTDGGQSQTDCNGNSHDQENKK